MTIPTGPPPGERPWLGSPAVDAAMRRSITVNYGIHHRDGVPWYDRPIPSRWHRCRAWSFGDVRGVIVERCPCGAARIDRGRWLDRNERRRARAGGR